MEVRIGGLDFNTWPVFTLPVGVRAASGAVLHWKETGAVADPGAASWMLCCSRPVIIRTGHFLSSHSLFAYITATLPRPPTLSSSGLLQENEGRPNALLSGDLTDVRSQKKTINNSCFLLLNVSVSLICLENIGATRRVSELLIEFLLRMLIIIHARVWD